MRTKNQAVAVLIALCVFLAPVALATGGAYINTDRALTRDDLPVNGYITFDLELTGYQIQPNYKGEDCVVIDWVFTNLGKEAVSFNEATFVNLYQGGMGEAYRLKPTVLSEYDEVNEDQPLGRMESLPVKTMHLTTSRDQDLRVIVYDLLLDDTDDTVLNVSLHLSETPAPAPLDDPEQIIIALHRHGFLYYSQAGEPDWYGTTTDDERILMGQTLLALFTSLGYDVSAYAPNTFAQALNDRYDQDKSVTIWQTACAELGVPAEMYEEIFYQ